MVLHSAPPTLSFPTIGPPGVATIQAVIGVSGYEQKDSDIFLPLVPAEPQMTVHLECNVQLDTVADAEFRWLFRGRPVATPTSMQNKDLLLSAPSTSELVGSVQCQVVTSAGVSSAYARLLLAGMYLNLCVPA